MHQRVIHTQFLCTTSFLLMLIVAVFFIPKVSFAEQLLWIDQNLNWTNGRNINRSGPVNITSPVNYTSGDIYTRYEVKSKPTSRPMCVQMCAWQDNFSRESCSVCIPFTDEGTYYVRWRPMPQWWIKDPSKPVDYSRSLDRHQLIIKDGNGVGPWVDTCSGSHCMGGSAAQHLPIAVDVESYITDAAHTFAKPASWSNCPDSICGQKGNWRGSATQEDIDADNAMAIGNTAAGTTNGTTGGTTSSTSGGTTSAPLGNACSLIQAGGVLPAGFGAPWNTLSSTQEILMKVFCTQSGATAVFGSGNQTQYVYHLAHEWTGTSWRQITLTGNQKISNAWFPGEARVDLTKTSQELAQTQYVVGFICLWTGEPPNGSGWKCGCRDQTCTTPHWQLQAYRNGQTTTTGATGNATTGNTTTNTTGTTGSSGNWHDTNHPYRTLVEVDINSVPRTNWSVEVPLNLGTLATQLGGNATISAIAVKVVEVNPSGALQNATVPAEYMPAQGAFPSKLLLYLSGQTNAKRYFQVYFGGTAQNAQSVITLDENTTDEGMDAYKITTPNGTYFYHTKGGGFSSLLDADGSDWLSWRDGGGSAGEFRGIPNMVHNGDGGSFFHPGFTNSTSEILSRGPLAVRLRTESNNGKWAVVWDMYPSMAKMTVEKVGSTAYWFLYEGTPGGSLNTGSDYVVRSTGQRAAASQSWNGDLPGPEWVYFEDSAKRRAIGVASVTEDTAIDSYYQMENNMTVFGFGRQGINKHLRGTNKVFLVGMIDASSQQEGEARMKSLVTEPAIRVGQGERR